MACSKRDTKYIILLTLTVLCIYLPLNVIFTLTGTKWSRQQVHTDVSDADSAVHTALSDAKLKVTSLVFVVYM